MNKKNKIEVVESEVIDTKFTEEERKKYVDNCKEIEQEYTELKATTLKLAFLLYDIYTKKTFQIDGYNTITDMAMEKFHISRGFCNNCINICKKYGTFDKATKQCIGIRNEYQGFSVSQLCEMLPLKAETREKVTSDMTVKQIRELKKATKQKPKKKKQSTDSDVLNKQIELFKTADIKEIFSENKNALFEKIQEFQNEHPDAKFDISITLLYTE